ADLLVGRQVCSMDAGRVDAQAPPRCGFGHRRLIAGERALVLGDGDIAAVTDDVDETCLRERSLDPRHRSHVPGGLVAPPWLALALGVELVEGAQDRS